MKKILIAGVVILLILIAAYATRNKNPEPVPPIVVCTMEAKLCPDGSSVGRSGPLCEFSECPAPTENSLETYTNETQGITFKYPKELPTTYITATEWPPKAEVLNGPFTCNETGSIISVNGKTEKNTINGQTYCVNVNSEGAAGSTYLNYTYTFENNSKTVKLAFTLRETQCMNYDEPKQSECKSERETFNIDSIVNQIAQTVVVTAR